MLNMINNDENNIKAPEDRSRSTKQGPTKSPISKITSNKRKIPRVSLERLHEETVLFVQANTERLPMLNGYNLCVEHWGGLDLKVEVFPDGTRVEASPANREIFPYCTCGFEGYYHTEFGDRPTDCKGYVVDKADPLNCFMNGRWRATPISHSLDGSYNPIDLENVTEEEREEWAREVDILNREVPEGGWPRGAGAGPPHLHPSRWVDWNLERDLK